MFTKYTIATAANTPAARSGRRNSPNLGRAHRAELLREQAIAASTPEDKLALAYKGAREKGAMLLGPPPRRGPNNVWIRLEHECPAAAEWAHTFRGYSALASAIDAGLPRKVEAEFARQFLWAVGQFFEKVEALQAQERAAA